jgi:hypothetical protein
MEGMDGNVPLQSRPLAGFGNRALCHRMVMFSLDFQTDSILENQFNFLDSAIHLPFS